MIIEKQFEILKACKEGKTIQVKLKDSNIDWSDIKNPEYSFDFNSCEYRIKSEHLLPKSWKEYCASYTRTNMFFINENSCIDVCPVTGNLDVYEDKNLCNSKEEAEAFLALMQLLLLRKAYVGDWEADFSGKVSQYCICNISNTIVIGKYRETNKCLSFPTTELAQKFLDNFKSIIKLAKPLI